MNTVIAVVLAYLIGSISFAIVISRLFGLSDPRRHGSGNPGATNVLRTGNKAAAALTLLGDAAKGFVVVWFVRHLGPDYGLMRLDVALVAVAVFAGHLWPVYHGFKGGKGVATAAGILLAINLWLGVATIVTWVIIAFFFRYSSLAALVAAVFAPLYYLLLFGPDGKALALLVISALLIWRHQANIGRLIAGKETRIGSRR
jgi:glycerol-3-phosphate acyltransferase PlsY